MGAYSVAACLTHLTIDHASFSRRSTVPTRTRDADMEKGRGGVYHSTVATLISCKFESHIGSSYGITWYTAPWDVVDHNISGSTYLPACQPARCQVSNVGCKFCVLEHECERLTNDRSAYMITSIHMTVSPGHGNINKMSFNSHEYSSQRVPAIWYVDTVPVFLSDITFTLQFNLLEVFYPQRPPGQDVVTGDFPSPSLFMTSF